MQWNMTNNKENHQIYTSYAKGSNQKISKTIYSSSKMFDLCQEWFDSTFSCLLLNSQFYKTVLAYPI